MSKRTSQRRFIELLYNPITYIGVVTATVVFFLECFLFCLSLVNPGHNLYLGLITFLVFPPFLFLGLVLIPIGALWKWRRQKLGKSEIGKKWLAIDLSVPAQLNTFIVLFIVTSILALMSLVGSYKAFHYTESVEFCGALCHTVMHPEYTTFKSSPHGRVKCAECHIGPGADWYVQAKLSGIRQVIRTLSNSFERPIKTPVENLRPAEDTCKQCHWPGKYFGTFDFNRMYYTSEEDASPWFMRMLLNVGGGDYQSYGVHAHMNLDHDIFYAAEDDRRQEISWVKSVDKEGGETIFTTEDSPWINTPPPPERIRQMDCIDCHNRPTHQFLPPDRLINRALQYGEIDPNLTDIKALAVEALAKEYSSTEEAITSIDKMLRDFYSTDDGSLSEPKQMAVEKAIQKIVELYKNNMFPEMKTRWETHPDNIGHFHTPGCFRCHSGEHRSSAGKTISRDCNACHLVVEQGPLDQIEKNIEGLVFRHPVDIGDSWKEMSCSDCHTGAQVE
ncbi:NapC/NirT family cytochrome c [Planctomycetota bacterium]